MSLKHQVYSISLFLVLLPFVLMTDIFPLLRFAMFAEPIKKMKYAELFFVTISDGGKQRKYDPEKYELQEESFQYLLRNYFYRGQSRELLQKLNKIEKEEEYKFFRVTFRVNDPEKKDTVLIDTLINGE